ncbi:glycosyltransferase [Mesorhizobium sp. WSM2239]|uniref:Glycosyltransferase n=2 Tax=unclassified Mesorhizobium TaxID=325217 RepID=A0AAU8DGB1_9HYPH
MTDCNETTIVITTCNRVNFLGEAIESALAQTVHADEIIVVDDGSADDPAAVVAQYPGTRLIRQENGGLAAARNTGLAAASGRYIAFLDADDRLRPRMIELNLGQFQRHPECALVYGAYDYINEQGAPTSTVPVRLPSQDAYADFLAGNLIGMHGTVLYRREWLQAAGGFDPSLQTAEDYDVFLRLSSRGHPVAATRESLAEYRRHGTNISNDLPYMLERVLAVLGRHKDAAASRPDWLAAYRKGVADWKSDYSGKQLVQMRHALRNMSEIGPAAVRTARMVALSPDAVASRTVSAVKSRIRPYLNAARVRFGSLDRTTPISRSFGYDRGKPVDRHYVEQFLAKHSADIGGRVLEIGDNQYTMRFGGDRVEVSNVLNRYPGHPTTTFVGDLTDGAGLPSDAFDCFVLTQTLHLLFDLRSAVATLHRVLKPGGVLLVTVPWASPIDRGEWGADWFWSISPNGLQRLLQEAFGPDCQAVTAYGNVKVATAFLYGLAEHELRPSDFEVHDPHCPVIVAGRAVKAGSPV